MKKKIYGVICIILAAATAAICFGCKSALQKREAELSELRDELMVAKTDRATVTLCSGIREDPFEIDGKSGNKTDFTVLTAVISDLGDDAIVNYKLTAGEKIYDGTLTRHPFKSSYSAELGERVKGSAVATLSCGEYSETIELKTVFTGDEISADEALKIAEKRLKSRIDGMTDKNALNAEVYVRYLENPISSAGGYYWYVAFCPQKYEVYAVLIDPITREITAVRE